MQQAVDQHYMNQHIHQSTQINLHESIYINKLGECVVRCSVLQRVAACFSVLQCRPKVTRVRRSVASLMYDEIRSYIKKLGET